TRPQCAEPSAPRSRSFWSRLRPISSWSRNTSGKSRPASYQHCRHEGGSMGTNCLTSRSIMLHGRFDTTHKSSPSHYRRNPDRNATHLLNDLVKRKRAGQQIDMDTRVKEGDHSPASASASLPFPAVCHATSVVLLPLPEEC